MTNTPRKPQFAIALQYDGEGAPRVTAKGGGELAEQILALAKEMDIPLEEDAVLTEALARVDLGNEIPPALYLAVAEVLAFAYLISGKTPEPPKGSPSSHPGRENTTLIEGTPIRVPESKNGKFV